MNNESTKLLVPLFSEKTEPEDYDLYITGNEPDDTLGKALKRYADELGLRPGQVTDLTGISRSGIYSYYKDQRNIGYENLILLCVGLRLHPLRQDYLFSFTSHKVRKSDDRYYTLKSYLANCAFIEKYTVKALNDKLRADKKQPLISKKRSSGNE